MNVTTIEQKPSSPLAIVRQKMERMSGQFEAALPKHIPVERFKRVVMTAIQQTPALLDCDQRSLWNAAMRAAQDGLLPDGREGAMVPFKSQVQWMPMVAGVRKKVRNSGEIATWETEVVYEKDHFEFELGDDPFIKHKPHLGADRGKPIAAYSIATLKTGEKSREVMSIAEIERIRSMAPSKNSPAWKDHFGEMCRKTVARRHSKVLPMSTDLDDLLRGDDEIMDVKAEVNERQQAERLSGSNILDVFAGTPVAQEEAAATEESVSGESPKGRAAEPADQGAPQASSPDPDNPMPEFSAADAFEMGREARKVGKARKATPPEWRNPDGEPFIGAWIEGWDAQNEQQRAGAEK
jgi:recombination protein RecT